MRPFRIAVRKFGPFESAMQKIWDSFCVSTGCTLPVEMVPMDLEPLHQSLITDRGLLNGDWDVAHINTDWLFEAYTSGALINLKPLIQNNPPDDFPNGWSESLLGMQQFGNDIAGLPFHDGPECLIYRKDLFENENEKTAFYQQYGRALTPPKTWDEFRDIAHFFHRPEQNLYGSIFAALPDGHNTVFDFALQLWTRGGSLVNEKGNVNINTPAALQGLQFYKEILNDKKAVHPKCGEYESVQSGLAFARGEAAMMVNWFGFASMCEVYEESKVKGKVNITHIPAGPEGESASLNVYWLYAIGSGSQHQALAYDFIRFAINRQNDKLLTLEGGIGCRKSTWHDAEINQIIPYYYKLEELHQHAQSLPVKSNWAAIAKVIDEVVLKAINTEEPIGDLLKEGQRSIDLLEG